MSGACVTKFKSVCITKAVKFGIWSHLYTDNFYTNILYDQNHSKDTLYDNKAMPRLMIHQPGHSCFNCEEAQGTRPASC